MKKLSNGTLQHLPYHWGQLSGTRKVWYLSSCNCSPVLENWWGILSTGELQLFIECQVLTPEFIYRNWKHFSYLIKLVVLHHQTLPERLLIQLSDSLSASEFYTFCLKLDISRKFMMDHWHLLPEYAKMEYFIDTAYGKSFSKGELVMFLSDSNASIRKAASRYLTAGISHRFFWKVVYYLKS